MDETPLRARAPREEPPLDSLRVAEVGRLAADDETVQTLGEMFAGPLPWINDWFR